MKKSLLVAALTSTFVIGSFGTSFAAENPFTDVPRGHWAYDAVMQLAEDGIVEGYGDGTFRGERTITRYEMAQIIARALEKMPEPTTQTIIQQTGPSNPVTVTDPNSARQSDVDRLGADHSSLAGRVDQIGYDQDTLSGRIGSLEGSQGALSSRIDRLNSDNASLSQRVDALEGNQEEIARQVDADRALLNRLAAEFSSELNALNVRVDNLEEEVNRFKINGKVEYTYTEAKVDRVGGGKDKTKSNGYVFRMEPSAVINNHWSAHARVDINGEFKDDEIFDAAGKRAYVQAEYDGLDIKAGKIELYPNDHGTVVDDDLHGGQLTYQAGDFTLMGIGGRLRIDDSAQYDLANDSLVKAAKDVDADGNLIDTTADFAGINIQYAHPTGFEIGAGYYNVSSDIYKYISRDGDADKNKIWSANVGYNFSDKAKIWGAYAKSDVDLAENTYDDDSKYSWQAQLSFGDYDDASAKGQWNIYGAYRRYGIVSSIFPTGDGVDWGQKGWEVGVAWAPWKNVGLLAKYFDGKNLTDGQDAEKVFGRVEFFF